MGKHTENVFFSLLDDVNKEDFQQGKVQVEHHIQDAAPHQHPHDIGMDVGWRNLSVMEEFFEKGRKRKTEPRIELLLGEINGVVRNFLCGHGVPIH